ncbi:MAG: YIP1 family protein [Euryarchaeota archaeon]|nr:YIP1 family protein [Euryarchaeota archaeon]
MTNVLANPDRFFAELSQRGVNLSTPFTIVLVAAIVATISNVVMSGVMAPLFPRGVGVYRLLPAMTHIISGFIAPFGLWLLCSAIFYAISRLFGGTGSFERVFEFVGYGFIPHVAGSIVGLATILVETPDELLSEGFSQMHPLITIFSTIQILLALCGAVIWVFAVKHARNIGTKHAIITVFLIPVILYLLVSVVLCLAYVGVM